MSGRKLLAVDVFPPPLAADEALDFALPVIIRTNGK